MTNKKSEIVKPVVIEGVEFYASNLTDEVGVSQVGLARLCGVSEFAIRALLSDLGVRSVPGRKMTEKRMTTLAALIKIFEKLIAERVSAIDLTSEQQANIVPDIYAAEIIDYYASKGNETAIFSRQKFKVMGIQGWVRKITKSPDVTDLSAISATLNLVLNRVEAMSMELTEMKDQTAGYRIAKVKYSGLEELMKQYEEPEYLALPETEELFTLAEYLQAEKRLTFNKSQMCKFSTEVASVYKLMKRANPEKKAGISAKGYKSPEVNAYPKTDFPILDLAFKQTVLSI